MFPLLLSGPAPPLYDVQISLNDVIYRLGFADAADFSQPGAWVTGAELLEWADEAIKRLAWSVAAFLTYDNSIPVVAGTSLYLLPSNHVYTVAAWVNGAPLRITRVSDLYALDADWPAAGGPPTRCSLDAGRVGTITLYPSPSQNGTLSQVAQEFPAATVAGGATTTPLPLIFQDYLSYAMLRGARMKESDSRDLAMANHYDQRMKLLEQVFEHMYGPGQ